MFDKFDVWQFRDNANCWDYVRTFLVEKHGVPESAVPKYGILPDDKKSLNMAAKEVAKNFVDSKPCDGAIACHCIGNAIVHVGVVDKGYVRHTSKQWGTIKSTIREYEALAKTVYKKYAYT